MECDLQCIGRMRSLALATAVALTACAAPSAARAAEAGWQRADAYYAPRADAPGWYGWQLLVADALSVGVLAWGIDQDRTDLIVGGSLGYALAGPAIHLLHGRNRAGLQSLGQRIGGPLSVGYVALRVAEGACDGDKRCGAQWGLGGLAVGGLIAILVDAVDLAGPEDVAVAPTAMRDARGAPIWGIALVVNSGGGAR